MGFSVLLRSTSKSISAALENVFEDQRIFLNAPIIDWSDKVAMANLLRNASPRVVVNYGLGSDLREDSASLAHLREYCVKNNTPLIHVSSHRVFGASATGEMPEDATPFPDDELGGHLRALELQCQSVPRHMILRRGWMLDGGDDNILGKTILALQSRTPFFASDHDYGRPVRSSFIAGVLLAMVQQILCGADNWGVFHLRSADKCSEAEFCDAVLRILTSIQDTPLQRPSVSAVGDTRRLLSGNAYLGGYRCTNNFGIQQPPWRKGLKTLVSAYINDGAAADSRM